MYVHITKYVYSQYIHVIWSTNFFTALTCYVATILSNSVFHLADMHIFEKLHLIWVVCGRVD